MDMPDRYCEECGAANTHEANICFACSRPLDVPETRQTQDAIREDARTQDAPVYVQITLSATSQTTIQFVQPVPPPAQELLHGRYRVLGQVGTGGFGAVYKARDLKANGRMVAIKAIELDILSASQVIEATDTFNRELNLLSSLDHPHLPTIYEHFIDETHWYLVMDFIDGEPLDEYLQQLQESCLPLKQVLNIGIQICDVLRYLHQLQPPVIFRDVKPANIMRTPGGRLYLIDFGIARRFKPGKSKDTTPLGSPGYAAPEQYGKAQTTPRSDIYSLGATLYFLLTGYDPASTPFHLPPIRSLCPTLPESLAELITSMLALDPAERPASIAEVQQVLHNYSPSTRHTTVLPQSQAFAAPPVQPVPQPVPSPSHRLRNFLKGIFSVAMTCLVVAACTLTAHFMGTSSFSQATTMTIGQAPVLPEIFRVPYIGQLRPLDPFTSTDPQAVELENLLFGRLISFDQYGHITSNGLASSWQLSADFRHWTFHLNRAISFSDASPVTSLDVAASLDYALAAPSAPTTCPFFSLIKDADQLQTHSRASLLNDSINTPDAATVVLTTTRPAPYFLATLASPCGSILKKTDLDTWGSDAFALHLAQMAFSSTYTVTAYIPGQTLTLAYLANNAFQQMQPPQAPAQISVQSYPDAAASSLAYLAGQLDLSPTSSERALQNVPTRFAHLLTLHYYGMNYLARPFDNLAIRQAFALALDKNALTEINMGTPTSSLLGAWRNPAYDTNTHGDPPTARERLAQGLAQEGLTSASQLPAIAFAYQAGQPGVAAEVNAASQKWKEVLGVEVTPHPLSNLAQALAATRGNASLQLWATDYTPAYLDPYAMVGLPFAQGSPLNAVNFGQNSSSDATAQQELQHNLIKDVLSSGDIPAIQVYQKTDLILTSDVAWLPISLVIRPYIIGSAFAPPFSSLWSPWGSQNYCSDEPPC